MTFSWSENGWPAVFEDAIPGVMILEHGRATDQPGHASFEDRVPELHPLRGVRRFVDELAQLPPLYDADLASTGRPAIAPEQLLRASLLQVFYSLRSERLLCEQLQYNLLFRWFVGLGDDAETWLPSTFSKNRDRLLEAESASAFFARLREEARVRGWTRDEHFTVDSALLDAWASRK